jgi:hypothetical protein
MKKKVLKVVASTTLVAAMVVGMQINKAQRESSLMMENLEAIAIASDSESTSSSDCYSYTKYTGTTGSVHQCSDCSIKWTGRVGSGSKCS